MDVQELINVAKVNKDWLLIPGLVSLSIIVIGLVLMMMNARGVSFFVKTIFVILLFSAPVLGFFLGPYIHTYVKPYMDMIFRK